MTDSTSLEPNHRLDGAAITPQATPVLVHAAEQAGAFVQRGIDALAAGSQSLRSTARKASDGTVGYVQAEPLKAVLMAAAAGAAIVALAGFALRRRDGN